jgi:guanylate cyclase
VIEEQRSNEEHLRAQADRVLHNILPASVAERLKHGEVVADSYEEASVLFADMVNFTPFSSNLTPSQIVTVLNEIFSQFDLLAERHKLEKIKTTGDGYMVAAGLHLHCSDHAEVLVRLGLDMCEYFNRQVFSGQKLGLRVGINSGPVMAAVIGLQRFSYDLWGDAVNVAKRMESHGQSGVVQITEATYDKVKNKFICKHQGRIEIKGKGKMSVWHVVKCN